MLDFTIFLSHIQTLFSLMINNYVNTGNRNLDTCIIGILCLLFGTIIKIIPIYFQQIIDFIDIYITKNDEKFHPDNVDPQIYSPENILKYKFVFNLSIDEYYDSIAFGNITEKGTVRIYRYKLAEYIIEHFGSFGSSISTNVSYSYKSNKCILNDDCDEYISTMPIHRYIKNNRYEYIIIFKNSLYCNDIEELGKFINQFKPKSINNINTNERYIYEFISKDKLSIKGTVNKRKTFDNLYFDQKDQLIKLLDKFKSGTLYPKTLSLDNKLGLVFHGPPGTAKTGTCSAIANYLDRHILLLNSLLNLPRQDILDVINLNKKTHVIVLDEADSILCNNIIDDNVDYESLIVNSKTNEERAQYILKRNEQIKLTKSMSDEDFILKLLDSFGDDNDRIIIMTTNYPDKINKRFLRPGRIDDIILFGYCSMKMFRDISLEFHNNIDELIEENKEQIENILKLNITPLILINRMVKHPDFIECLNSLSIIEKEEYEGFKR